MAADYRSENTAAKALPKSIDAIATGISRHFCLKMPMDIA
jgi:hypothetical protein